MRVLSTIAEIQGASSDYDLVVLTMPLGKEKYLFHLDALGLGNQIAALIAALSICAGKPIVGYHGIQLVTPWSLLTRGRRLDFLRRSSFRVSLRSSVRRSKLDPPISGDMLLDKKERILFFSAQLLGQHSPIYRNFRNLSHVLVAKELQDKFRIKIPGAIRSGSLGIHVRRGDFAATEGKQGFLPNTRVPVDHFLAKAQTAIDLGMSKSLEIFCDSRLTRSERRGFAELSARTGVPVTYHSKWDSAKRTIEKMMAVEYLLVSNSTLSFWACVLGKVKGIKLFESLPVNGSEAFESIFIQI